MVLHGNCYVNMSQHSVAAFNAKTNKYKHTLLCELFNFGIDMPHESTWPRCELEVTSTARTNRTCKPPATNNTYFVGAITHAQTGNIFQRVAGSVRTYHVTNSDANCLTVAVFFRTKHPLLSPNEAPSPESNPISRYRSERRQSKMSKFPGIVLNNPTNVN